MNQNDRPAFLITIDTEGDNIWSRPRELTTKNAAFLPRFQRLCERFGLKPTYVTNWEMACDEAFVEFGRDVLKRGAGEIGLHVHAWNSPPIEPLTDDDTKHMPYLIEYPEAAIRDKVRVLTDKLEETFGTKMVSHRSGRWAFNDVYARILLDAGYLVDCSVTPGISRRAIKGDPNGEGGTDYRGFPERAYFVHGDDVKREGDGGLLEVPLTVMTGEGSAITRAVRGVLERLPKGARVARRFLPRHRWLRPNGHNRRQMLGILNEALAQRRDFVEFMLHSSEFMPGGSPAFPTAASIERLYGDLEALFSASAGRFVGMTLAQYRERFCGRLAHTK